MTEDAVLELGQLPNLQKLVITSEALTERGFQALAKLRQLQTLSINVPQPPLRYLAHISQLPNLRSLTLLSVEPLDRQGAQQLANLRETLVELEFIFSDVLDEAIPELAKLTKLRKLTFGLCKVSYTGLKELRKTLVACQVKTE
ncbi:MAG: hypothetical protein RMI91_09465 [Gemmatales bacterium]|nr:hypothetical protein [Gemmatales bacterium]MDW7994869.1 hypothetical protein [Gemmatales bacterium]